MHTKVKMLQKKLLEYCRYCKTITVKVRSVREVSINIVCDFIKLGIYHVPVIS